MNSGKVPSVALPTVDELVATLARSRFPTVMVEGGDDVLVYRRLEEDFAEIGLTILSANGRSNLLAVFERRADFSRNQQVIFVADRDLWVFSTIPLHYQSGQLIFTVGYSIENDMFVDGDLEAILPPLEKSRFTRELTYFCRWYALAVARTLDGKPEKLESHPNNVLDSTARYEALLTLGAGEMYPQDMLDRVVSEYQLLLRGKSLFALLVRRLTGYSNRSLLNFAGSRKGSYYRRIAQQVREHLDQVSPTAAHKNPSPA